MSLTSFAFSPYEPKIRHECGVFAVYGAEGAARLVALGLHALQHRGQEGCGIASLDGDRFYARRKLGLVGSNFSDTDLPSSMPGRSAVGHVRYSTTGRSIERNLQPLYADTRHGGAALAHNGNLTNAYMLRRELVESGAIFQTESDSEVILHLLSRARGNSAPERLIEALDRIVGGYALVVSTPHGMMAARDPVGIRPLVIGKRGAATVFASETTALDIVGAQYERDLAPGEVVLVTPEGLEAVRRPISRRPRTCAFEYIYFARPDSVLDGISVHAARKRMGAVLADEHPADVDIVVGVPDSGLTASLGFAEAASLPFDQGLIRSHFIGRTFIQPGQSERNLKVKLKHRANAAVLRGKRVVLIDDSIVRGTTSREIVEIVRQAGAREVHLRSACPPIRYPDYYGIDIGREEELFAAANPDVARMAMILGVDSLGFLSIEGLYRAVFDAPRDPVTPQLTDHYFTGQFPTPLADLDQGLLRDPTARPLLETPT